MRALFAGLCFLAFLAGGAFAPASAHPGHGAGAHAQAVQADDLSFFADALPAEVSAADRHCPAHGDGADGACALLHASCCGLHGGLIAASHPGDAQSLPDGGYRGPGPDTARAGAPGTPLFEPPRA